MTLGHPAQREEGAACVAFSEELEQQTRTRLDTARQTLPIGPRDVRRQRRDLEMLLDVDREVMADC